MDTPTSSSRSGRRTALGLVLLVLGTLLAFTGAGPLGSAASAQTASNNPDIVSWNAYANYPNTLPAGLGLPQGCNAFTVLENLSFSLNGGTPTAEYRDLGSMEPGDVVTMAWTGWTPGCETLITLSVKAASTPVFDPTTDQALVDFVGCLGPNDPTCTVQGGYQLQLTMPQQLCNYQTDAVVGPPLDVIGPAGSYYSNVWRQSHQNPQVAAPGPDMLIAANNGGPSDCAPPAVADVVCAAEGASLSIFNPDLLNTVRVDVLKNGVSIYDPTAPTDPDLLQPVGPNSTVPVIVPATPADGEFQLTVIAAGETIYDEPFTNDCTDLEVSADADCEAGVINLQATNGGVQPVTFTATASTPTGGTVPVVLDGTGAGSVAPSATESTTITFFANGNPVGEPIVIPPCEPPSVEDIQLACEEGVINVITTQPTGYTVVFAVTATVAGQPVDVTDNGDGTFTVASDGEAAVVTVTADGDTVFSGPVPGCDDPAASAVLDCETGGIAITTTQPDDHTVDFVVTANGTPVTLTNGAATTPIGDTAVRIVVTADGDTILDQTVQPCDEPEADATVDCTTTDTITVTTTQPTDHTVDFVATANGTPLTLTNGTATTPIGAAAVTIVVTADGVEIHRETIQPCTEVEGVQQNRPAQLPRTGSEDTGRLALALGLIVTGLGLVLFGEDRRLALLKQR